MRSFVLALVSVATLAGCVSEKCYPDCVPGYEADGCSCRPIPYSGEVGFPLGSCLSGGTCYGGLECIKGCPPPLSSEEGTPAGICSMAEREPCDCNGTDPCTTPGASCLRPACCGYWGICVKPEERKAICARPEAVRFDCANVASGG